MFNILLTYIAGPQTVSKNKRFVLSAVGCVFEVVLKGFVENSLSWSIRWILHGININHFNYMKYSHYTQKPHGCIQASSLAMHLDKQGSGYRPYGLWWHCGLFSSKNEISSTLSSIMSLPPAFKPHWNFRDSFEGELTFSTVGMNCEETLIVGKQWRAWLMLS